MFYKTLISKIILQFNFFLSVAAGSYITENESCYKLGTCDLSFCEAEMLHKELAVREKEATSELLNKLHTRITCLRNK